MYSAKNFFAWVLFVFIAILFIMMGIQGSAGKVLAVIFVPSQLEDA